MAVSFNYVKELYQTEFSWDRYRLSAAGSWLPIDLFIDDGLETYKLLLLADIYEPTKFKLGFGYMDKETKRWIGTGVTSHWHPIAFANVILPNLIIENIIKAVNKNA